MAAGRCPNNVEIAAFPKKTALPTQEAPGSYPMEKMGHTITTFLKERYMQPLIARMKLRVSLTGLGAMWQSQSSHMDCSSGCVSVRIITVCSIRHWRYILTRLCLPVLLPRVGRMMTRLLRRTV